MKFKRSLSLILACLLLSASFASCKKDGSGDTGNGSGADSNAVATTPDVGSFNPADYKDADYNTVSEGIYNNVLGDFMSTYENAKAEENLSKKWALMAVTEAKLLETAVMIPNTADGGNYAISRVAPYSVNYTLWGNDNDRFHQALVATDPITSEDRAEMKAKWKELQGTGTYEEWAKKYLADKGYTLKDSYTLGYATDPQTWDVLATSQAADSEAIVNTYDGLLEYDTEGTLQPALAESYTVSDDGMTYTFKIREGVKWVDSQGREVADVKADDFVAGMQHMCDAMGGLEYLVQGVIVNVSEYIDGSVTDFSKVGVKAVDDYTLEYTLTAPFSYFTTMFGYGVFAPLSRTYYESQGGKFGSDFDPSAESYKYGKTPDTIAYCGPYVVSNATEKNTIVFTANESYYNKDKINVKTITWLYNDGSDVTKAYNDMVAGTIDGCGLNSSALEIAKGDGNFDKYGYISTPGTTTFSSFFNVYRQNYANANDPTTVASTIPEAEQERSNAALANVHFRRAVAFATDRGSINAQSIGEELKLVSVRNTYTPGRFVILEEDVTIAINGKDTKFPAGTAYGEIIQAQLDADGVPIKAYDPAADDGVGSSDGYEGWFNPANAVAELNAAIAQLAEQGITVDAENPIYLDLPYPSNSETYTNKENAYKQSVESVLGGKVIINLVECKDFYEWYYAGYWAETGGEANYHIYDVSGWGPDYGDPSTYLDTFLPDYAGYMTKCIGIY